MDAALLARVKSRVAIVDLGYRTPCWISDRAAQPKGYTKIAVGRRIMLTHRVAYEAAVGPIPAGMVIDHLCRRPACANPDHLEPVTMRENLLRGDTLTAAEVAQTHCHRGHEFTEANTYLRPDRPGRICRQCSRGRARRYRAAA